MRGSICVPFSTHGKVELSGSQNWQSADTCERVIGRKLTVRVRKEEVFRIEFEGHRRRERVAVEGISKARIILPSFALPSLPLYMSQLPEGIKLLWDRLPLKFFF